MPGERARRRRLTLPADRTAEPEVFDLSRHPRVHSGHVEADRALTLDYGLRLSHMPTQYNTRPEDTLDAVFLASKWDPAKAPRYYVPDPRNSALIIDPANPSQPLPANLANSLRYTIVPGSGDPLNGVVALGQNGQPKAGIPNPRAILFAPRGGFAWTPFEDQKTVLRGGFGWAYNRNTSRRPSTGSRTASADPRTSFRQAWTRCPRRRTCSRFWRRAMAPAMNRRQPAACRRPTTTACRCSGSSSGDSCWTLRTSATSR